MSDKFTLRWAVGEEQVDRALASAGDVNGKERAMRRLAAGDTIDEHGTWTPAKRHDPAALASLMRQLRSTVRGRCEALASRDPGRAS